MLKRIIIGLIALSVIINAQKETVTCVDCPEYVALSASEKSDVIWKKIEESEYDEFPNNWVGLKTNVLKLGQTAYNGTIGESFDRFSDEYMTEHSRVIHTHGTVAKVEMIAEESIPGLNTNLTGLFSGGMGVIRMSLVKSPFEPCLGIPFTKGCFTPGLALKIFRDGTDSGNLLAMYILGEGQELDFNFMKNQHKTWVPKPVGAGAAVVNKIFAYAATPPNRLSADEFAEADHLGSGSDDEVSPPNVYFVPNKDIQFASTPHEFRDDFKTLPSGSVLYDMVIGVDENTGLPADCLCYNDINKNDQPCLDIYAAPGCNAVTVAKVVTRSDFKASYWGDEKLFFQHDRHDKKARFTCKFDTPFPDTEEYRNAADHNALCVADADTKCKSTMAISPGCPFSKNSEVILTEEELRKVHEEVM